MLNIAVCISGGGTDLQSVIDACERGEINGAIKLVISNRKNAYGLTRARNHGIKAEVIRDEDAILEKNVNYITIMKPGIITDRDNDSRCLESLAGCLCCCYRISSKEIALAILRHLKSMNQ